MTLYYVQESTKAGPGLYLTEGQTLDSSKHADKAERIKELEAEGLLIPLGKLAAELKESETSTGAGENGETQVETEPVKTETKGRGKKADEPKVEEPAKEEGAPAEESKVEEGK